RDWSSDVCSSDLLPAGAWPLVLGRGGLHVVAVTLWFFAMARIPVAEVTAIGYLNPIVVTVGAALLFGETLAARRIAAIAIALLGALVVLRPGLREVTPGHLAQLGAAVSFGLSYLIAKRLSADLPAGALVALLSLTVTVGLRSEERRVGKEGRAGWRRGCRREPVGGHGR